MKEAAIIDYGAGNLRNVKNAIEEIGITGTITNRKEDLDRADLMILPGVGAFRDAMEKLQGTELVETIKHNVDQGKILLGICLGMQMLFDASEEGTRTQGLGLIPGEVRAFKDRIPENLKIPHMGWNSLNITREDPFMRDVQDGEFVYFVHSFFADPTDFDADVLAWADYGVKVPAVVRHQNVIGTQFHPEKSAEVGRKMLVNLKKII